MDRPNGRRRSHHPLMDWVMVRLATLVVLASFSLTACTKTIFWQPITSSSNPPKTLDANDLVGRNARFLMADSTEVLMRPIVVSGSEVRGYAYAEGDTLDIDLQNVLRIDREMSGARPKKGALIVTGVLAVLLVVALVNTEITLE